MWISGGEHELAENIVHLVLAKIPGGPPGSKGVSLFVVTRYRDGAPNGVTLAGLNHKMGYRGTVNCLLDFGGSGECVGELIGEPHQGLRQMFHMMNEARIGVGIGAAAIGCAGYEIALRYARERRQGRLPGQRDPSSPMLPLIAHADVRRMLLKAKSQAQGALALCLYAARLVNEVADGDAEAQRLLDLLTPIVKAWPAEHALQANDLAIQVLGGAGYTRDFPLERMYRDNRLNPIHEGTNGIQAVDLLGRKVLGDGRPRAGTARRTHRSHAAGARWRSRSGARRHANWRPCCPKCRRRCRRCRRWPRTTSIWRSPMPRFSSTRSATRSWRGCGSTSRCSRRRTRACGARRAISSNANCRRGATR